MSGSVRAEGAPGAALPTTVMPAPSCPARPPTDAARRRLDSRQLFQDGQEIDIDHAGSVYRLRITSLGKLILTK